MKVGAYHKFWEKIHQQARENHLPLRVIFELTYQCNFHCQHCYVPKTWRRKKELNTAGIFDIIRQIKDAGCFYLGFTGGEIFLRRDIWQILEFSRQQGIQIILYTNGFFINEGYAKRIADIGVNKVDITLPGMSAKVFEAITDVKGSRQAVFSAIDHLRKYKVDLAFKTCLLKSNQGEIKTIEEFCAKIKAPHRLTDSPLLRIDGLMIDQDKPTKAFRCGGGSTQCAITPAGEVKLCPMVDWPKIKMSRADNFHQIWARLPEMITDGECCKHCPCGLGELCVIQ